MKHAKSDTIEVRGFLSGDHEYFDAYQERSLIIAEANTKTDQYGNFIDTRISARKASEATVAYV